MLNSPNQTNAPLPADGGIELSQIIKEQNELIWIQPVCDFFNIGRKWQVEVIRKDPFLASAVKKTSHQVLFGDKKDRLALPKKAFIRWVQLINPEIVKPDLKDKLIFFQAYVFDYLYGSAVQREHESSLYKQLVELETQRATINAELKTIRAALKKHWMNRLLGQNGHAVQQKLPLGS